jgi:hypothetical protein
MGDGRLLWSAHASQRYLVDAYGNPVLPVGEGAWTLNSQRPPSASTVSRPNASPAATQEAGQRYYLNIRRSMGFNCFGLQLISRYQDNSPNDDQNTAPFTTPGDLATFNSTYFQRARDLVILAGTYGFTVFVFPAWAGYDSNQGFYDMLGSNTQAKRIAYGTAVANTFADLDNIVWGLGGDKPGSFSVTSYDDIMTGILAVDTRHLFTSHWNFNDSHSHPGSVSPGWEQICSCYDWEPGGSSGTHSVYEQIDQAYQRGTSPAMMMEALYEENSDFGYTEKIVRTQSAMTMLMGGKGFWFGHEGVWHLGATGNLPSQSRAAGYNLFSNSVNHQVAIASVFKSRRWHELIPDPQGASIISAGRGTYGGNSYLGVAYSPDRRLVMAYVPTTTSFTMQRSFMAGPFREKWIDPCTGQVTAASGTQPAPNTGTQARSTTEKGVNAGGDTDYFYLAECDPSLFVSNRGTPVVTGGPVSSARMI